MEEFKGISVPFENLDIELVRRAAEEDNKMNSGFESIDRNLDYTPLKEEFIGEISYEAILGNIAFSLEHWYPGVFTGARFNDYEKVIYVDLKIPLDCDTLEMVQRNQPEMWEQLSGIKINHKYIYWRHLKDLLNYLYDGPRFDNGEVYMDMKCEKYLRLKDAADIIDMCREKFIYSKVPRESDESHYGVNNSIEDLIYPW